MADKTWSIVADKLGGHWHATIRRGVEGSRAKCGELAFDLSDAEDVKQDVEYLAGRIVTYAIVSTISELGKRELFRSIATPGYFAIATVDLGELIRAEIVPWAVELAIERFGVRVDLAKVNG